MNTPSADHERRSDEYRDLLELWAAWWNGPGREQFHGTVLPPLTDTAAALACTIRAGEYGEREHVADAVVDRLRSRLAAAERALSEIARPYCEHSTSGVGACYRHGRTELHDERGGYISVCHSCFADRALRAARGGDAR